MSEIVVAHSGQLDRATLMAALGLLEEVFTGELTEQDWEHSLGGLHALAWEGDQLVGHASMIQRRLLHGGRALRAGYIEGVGVRADRRRLGMGAAMMSALERVAVGAYEVMALGSTDEAAAFYANRGWHLWQGPTSAMTPAGVIRTPDEDDCIYVFPLSAELDLHAELTCDWREGDVW